jgi:hypothetical protein
MERKIGQYQGKKPEQYSDVIKQSESEMLQISILDVDTIVANYMQSNVVPDLEQNGKKLKIPVIYGNAERWKSAQVDGYVRDKDGKIQLPLIMFKRNSIAKNEQMKFLKDDKITYPTVKKYSQKNHYDRFSLTSSNYKRRYDTYDVRMPDYVNLSYEVIVWTSYTEHTNKIIEQFSYSTDQYWGEYEGYKFKVDVSDFDTAQDIGANSERMIKTTFTLLVYAYILPKRTEQTPTTLKGTTVKKIVLSTEVVVNIAESPDYTDETTRRLLDKYGDALLG